MRPTEPSSASSRAAARLLRERERWLASTLASLDSAHLVSRVPARLTSHAAIGGASFRWLYDWVEAQISIAHAFDDRPGGFAGQALNFAEAANTATEVAWGVLVSNLPGTFQVRPVTGFVEMSLYRRTDGSLFGLFSAPVIDGGCTVG